MSIDRLMDKDAVHTYNGLLFSHKKNGMMPFSPTWRDLEIVILSEVNHDMLVQIVYSLNSYKCIFNVFSVIVWT